MIKYSKFTDSIWPGNFTDILCQNTDKFLKIGGGGGVLHPYITKKFRKEIMKRSQLENIYRKALTEESLKAYKKQKNYVSRLYEKERKMFFNSLNPSVISDNRKFWKTVKPLFSNKGNYGNKIKLVENEEIIDDDTKVAEELNNFFKTAVASLDIHENPYTVENVENMSDPVEKAIK